MTETFGDVVLEALASGLILLAYDYAAARAHVTHRDNGFDWQRVVERSRSGDCFC